MKLTEDRLRAALAETAHEILAGSIRPLDLSAVSDQAAGHTRRGVLRVGGHRGIKLLAAPVATVAAVVAVIAASTALSGGSHATRPGAHRPSAGLASVPPYYMAAADQVSGANGLALRAVVHRTVNGKAVATFGLPKPYVYITGIAGSDNDTTFVLSAQKTAKTELNGPDVFFLARFNPATGKVLVVRLQTAKISAPSQLAGMALSTDGTKLAVAVSTTHKRSTTTQISVYSLATGKVDVWKSSYVEMSNGGAGPGLADPTAMSWASDGMLAFNAQTFDQLNFSTWLLNTATGGGNLLADSHFVVKMEGHGPWNPNGDGLVTPSGTRVVTTLWRGYPDRSSRHLLGEFAEFSTLTGKAVGVLYPKEGAIGVLDWTNSSGSVLIAQIQLQDHRTGTLGVVVGDKFTPLHGAPAVDGSAATIAF